MKQFQIKTSNELKTFKLNPVITIGGSGFAQTKPRKNLVQVFARKKNAEWFGSYPLDLVCLNLIWWILSGGSCLLDLICCSSKVNI